MSEAKARELLQRFVVEFGVGLHNGTGVDCSKCEVVRDARAYLAAVPAPPAGPPREPTAAMFEAGVRAMAGHATGGEMVRAIIKAALDAAPAAEPVAQQPPLATPDSAASPTGGENDR